MGCNPMRKFDIINLGYWTIGWSVNSNLTINQFESGISHQIFLTME